MADIDEKGARRATYMRDWNRRNPDRAKAIWKRSSKKYYESHREKIKEYALAYRRSGRGNELFQFRYHNDPDFKRRHIESGRKSRQKHRETTRLRVHNYRARKQGAEGRHTVDLWLKRVAFFGWRCRYCGIALNAASLTKDHQIPLSRNGSNWASNLVPACLSCNSAKRDKTLREFIH